MEITGKIVRIDPFTGVITLDPPIRPSSSLVRVSYKYVEADTFTVEGAELGPIPSVIRWGWVLLAGLVAGLLVWGG